MNGLLSLVGRLYWLPILLVVALWAWCMFLAYPLFLEARIRDGKSWIYLPRWWKSALRTPVTLGNVVLFASNVVFLAGGIYHFTAFGMVWSAVLLALSASLFYFLQRTWISRRYIQQREGYFLIYRRIAHLYHESGKPFNDMEIRNRCMYEHQNTLRRADARGRLLRYLDLLGRIQRKAKTAPDFVA